MTLKELLLQRKKENVKQFAVLIDPDDVVVDQLPQMVRVAEAAKVDYFFVGGSILTQGKFEDVVSTLKLLSHIPVVLFPGSMYQISPKADAILFLNLISGRNPEYLIGQQVQAAPQIARSGIEVVSTGYMLIDGGRVTTVVYMSGTMPIPSDKIDVAVSTALAGKFMGNQVIYMDAGSGALNMVSTQMVKKVKQAVDLPVIVGGGIKTIEQAELMCRAGADVIVVGNAIEKNPELIGAISQQVHRFNAAENGKM